jgi:hypothetical protein
MPGVQNKEKQVKLEPNPRLLKYIWYKGNHFLAALGVELRALHLLNRHSTTCTTMPDSKKSFILFIFILLVMFLVVLGLEFRVLCLLGMPPVLTALLMKCAHAHF